MGHHERRRETTAYSKQRIAALGFALMSGHGAALFLSILTPFQLIGRVTPQMLGGVMLLGAAAAAVFGLGVASAWNGLHADGDGETGRAEQYFKSSVDIALKALVVAVLLLAVGGVSLVFQPQQGEATASTGVPASNP